MSSSCRTHLNKGKAHIFFIGGAADQEPYYLVGPFRRINVAQRLLLRKIKNKALMECCELHVLGYNKIYHPTDIQQYVIDHLEPQDSIYIIGHSLGAWNGAHLCRQLVNLQYHVNMLITLDPVGEGVLVWAGSYIFREPQPEPKADFWINLRAQSQTIDHSDVVAVVGRRWNITEGPDINEIVNVHHANAYRIFTTKLSNGRRAVTYLIESLEELLDSPLES